MSPAAHPGTFRITKRRALLLALPLLILITAGSVIAGVTSTHRLPHLTPQHLAQLLSDDNGAVVIVLLRHAERCDRSDHQCLNDQHGITVRGQQQAVALGRAWRMAMPHAYQTFSSDTLRTRQSAQGFTGTASVNVLPQLGSHACKQASPEQLLKEVAERGASAKVLFTHSECLSHIAQQLADARFSPDYLTGIVLSVHSSGVRVEGTITAQEMVIAARGQYAANQKNRN
ncbi:histidine phosphatase family protein [Carnimonas bestiolae]|uniref:histidine phosphatase family protein n=1 Tax=Carnimonas bestiolae TaxID=3402172 RepID=UPI003EDB7F23